MRDSAIGKSILYCSQGQGLSCDPYWYGRRVLKAAATKQTCQTFWAVCHDTSQPRAAYQATGKAGTYRSAISAPTSLLGPLALPRYGMFFGCDVHRLSLMSLGLCPVEDVDGMVGSKGIATSAIHAPASSKNLRATAGCFDDGFGWQRCRLRSVRVSFAHGGMPRR